MNEKEIKTIDLDGLNVVSEGSSGVVYAYIQKNKNGFERTYALKKIKKFDPPYETKPALNEEIQAEYKLKVMKEIEINKTLKDSNIIKFKEVFITPDYHYCIMFKMMTKTLET